MFFSKAGKYEACGIFSIGHLALIIVTIIGIAISLKNTIHKSKKEIKDIIKKCTISMWIFEIIIITFKLSTGSIRDINNYVPLYYCSMLLYAGLLSSFGKGKLERTGNVFLATGGIVGGLVFILFPTTSLMTYPMLHLVSFHSFIFHGIMLYLGILVNMTGYIELEKNDIKYYSTLVGIICVFAYIVNTIYGSNLMFISQNFPGMPIEILYNLTGKLFTPVMIIAQMTLPFIIIYWLKDKIKIHNFIENREEKVCIGG